MWRSVAWVWIHNQTLALRGPHIYIYLNGCLCFLWSTGWGLLGFPLSLPCWLAKVPFWLFLGITAPLQKYPLLPHTFVYSTCPSSPRGRGLKERAKRGSVCAHTALERISIVVAVATTDTPCTFLLVSFPCPLFTMLLAMMMLRKPPKN